ncbi:hypothetical protein E2C01_048643 [Portunus trituberculatus]|uniref:Uncharacterized protein n=1 Tax=Portunus trituberculatus TaxID=210409 RepID=A0A5B7GC66_PORTR|nr:hypothetical protein [Portunus trituberculatus]
MPGAPGTFGNVYGSGVGYSHLALMPSGRPTTQDTEVNICHTAPMPGGQTPFQDVEAGICHTAPMPSGQLIILSCGLGTGETIPLSSVVEFGHSHAAKVSGGHLPTQNMSIGVSHKAPMPGNQTHVLYIGVGVFPSAPMPGGHPLPHSGLGHVNKWRKEKCQLLSSPFSDVLFDLAMVARVQDNEQGTGVGLFFSEFSFCSQWEQDKRADEEGYIS